MGLVAGIGQSSSMADLDYRVERLGLAAYERGAVGGLWAQSHQVDEGMNWYTRQKMKWISESLHVYSFINRSHLVRKFDISAQQASKDLQRFLKANPDRMRYEPKQKAYVAI